MNQIAQRTRGMFGPPLRHRAAPRCGPSRLRKPTAIGAKIGSPAVIGSAVP